MTVTANCDLNGLFPLKIEPSEGVRNLCDKIRVFRLYRKLVEYEELRKLVHGVCVTGVRNVSCSWNMV